VSHGIGRPEEREGDKSRGRPVGGGVRTHTTFMNEVRLLIWAQFVGPLNIAIVTSITKM
jgi:hypothetical protein